MPQGDLLWSSSDVAVSMETESRIASCVMIQHFFKASTRCPLEGEPFALGVGGVREPPFGMISKMFEALGLPVYHCGCPA